LISIFSLKFLMKFLTLLVNQTLPSDYTCWSIIIFSKTGAGGSPCGLCVVISCCMLHIYRMYFLYVPKQMSSIVYNRFCMVLITFEIYKRFKIRLTSKYEYLFWQVVFLKIPYEISCLCFANRFYLALTGLFMFFMFHIVSTI
jgi:hypothetical protein